MTHHWLENYDPEVGLWWATRSPAHTAPLADRGMKVHPGPDSVARLLLAAERDEWSELPVEKVLSTVLKMHEPDAPGNLCWYWEDGKLSSDSNASFFTGLGLIGLWLGYSSELPDSCRKPMQTIFHGLADRFLEKAASRLFHCLNVYLGDVVCGWLLLEILERAEERQSLAQNMEAAADYWLGHGFGFGEHLSDVYARVALQQVSLLLLFGNTLPDPVRARYQKVLDALLHLEDTFGGQPRVPTVRCSEFLTTPSRGKNHSVIMGNYRDRVRPSPRIVEREIGNNPPLGGLLHRAGWQDQVGPRQTAPPPEATISCFGGHQARAWMAPDIRLGSLSRFPLMPEAEFKGWGLAWQSFPVVFWRPSGDWGYLQWEIGEGGQRMCHPGAGPAHDPSQRGNPLTHMLPPLIGQTHSIQKGGDLLILRIMPGCDDRWETLTDRLRLVDGTAKVEALEPRGSWSQLVLRYPEREVSIHHLRLTPGSSDPVLVHPEKNSPCDWECRYSLKDPSRFSLGVWAISLHGRIETPPVLAPDPEPPAIPRLPVEEAKTLHWAWPQTQWKVRIDPFHATPLQNLSE